MDRTRGTHEQNTTTRRATDKDSSLVSLTAGIRWPLLVDNVKRSGVSLNFDRLENFENDRGKVLAIAVPSTFDIVP